MISGGRSLRADRTINRQHTPDMDQRNLRTRRRVLLLTQNLGVWGAQRQLVELAKGLDRKLFDVRVGTLTLGGPLTAELEERGIPIVDFERRWRWDLSPIWRLVRYAREQAIDILHSFMFLPNFYSRFAGRLAATPVVISSLRATGHEIDGWPRYFLDIATCFLCDTMIANSSAGAMHYTRHGGLRSRIVVIPNGFNPTRTAVPVDTRALTERHTLGRFAHRIGMVGALAPRKDQALLIRAFQRIVQTRPCTGLVLAGDGTRRAQLESLVQSLGLADRVVFLGTVNPQALYPLLDVYVQASALGEGISNSLLEAMAHGLPTVATDVGGNAEVVVDGITGHLVPPADPNRLAAVLLDLVSDRQRRQRMGQAGRERVLTTFSIDAMVAATQNVYERLLAGVLRAAQLKIAAAPAHSEETPSACSSSAS
ncbi:MAG: glycosyltransferase [Chloroflexi bacterium]|nr:MAG: glycosyltransferase [Chloroflexota bacterium]